MPRASLSPSPIRLVWLVTAVCFLVQMALWVLDHPVLLHSDSGQYLQEAADLAPGWARPAGYPVFLRAVFLLAGGVDLDAVVAAQALAGALLGGLTFLLAWRALSAPLWAAATAALLATVSPLALMLQRYVLADSVTVLAVALAVGVFFAFLARPSPRSAAALGVAAVAPLLLRAVWVFLPPLLLVLALLWLALHRPPAWRRFTAHLALAVLVAGLLWGGYAAAFHRRTTGTAHPAADVSGFSGWVLWASVARFAEPGDLDGIAGGELLLSDPASLERNGSWQIWDFGSTAHRLRNELCGGNFVEANRRLRGAALRLVARHPLAAAGQVATAAGRFFSPDRGNADYSRPLELDPATAALVERQAGARVLADRQGSRLGALYRGWRYSRPLWTAALLVALLAALVRPRRRFALLVVAAVGAGYLLVVAVAVGFIFIERYYLPVEYLAVLSLAGLAGALGTTGRAAEAEAVSD